MPFSKEILMGAGAGGVSDPERISQSDFESFTDNGTHATWTYNGYTASGGNVLTLASPGSNQFAEHNTYKSCLLYTSPSPRDRTRCRMPSSA